MRWAGRAIQFLLLAAAVPIAVANSDFVVVRMVPEGDLFPELPTLRMPLFVVILLAMVAGVIIGVVGEWIRAKTSR